MPCFARLHLRRASFGIIVGVRRQSAVILFVQLKHVIGSVVDYVGVAEIFMLGSFDIDMLDYRLGLYRGGRLG